MGKVSKPNTEDEVYQVMQKYCNDKGYFFSDTKLRYMAGQCYLTHESKGWAGVKYWPPLAYKWVINAHTKFGEQTPKVVKPKISKGKSVREQILEQEVLGQEDEF